MKTMKPMNYFKAIEHVRNKLDKKAQKYLDTLPFMANDDVLDRLWEIANTEFDKVGRSWDRCDEIPEWASSFLDGWQPYGTPRNGSLFFSLGWSVQSQDAHLRNLLERAEGREAKELPFGILANEKTVAKLAGLKPD